MVLDDGTAQVAASREMTAAGVTAAGKAATSWRRPNESAPHELQIVSGARGFRPYHPDIVIPEGSDEHRWGEGAVADDFDGMRVSVRHGL